MIRAVFTMTGEQTTGFALCGHAGAGVAGTDIVCAAVSSAAYMTANTLTEICGAAADVTEADGEMTLTLHRPDAATQTVMQGFLLHMQGLREQYPAHIEVTIQHRKAP